MSISAVSVATLVLRVPSFTSCSNSIHNSTFLSFPLHSSYFPRTSRKSSLCFVSRVVPTLSREMHKQCMLRALSSDETVTSKEAIAYVQETPQSARKEGNDVSSSKTTAPARKKTVGGKKINENISCVEGSESDVGVNNRRKKNPQSQDNCLEFEEGNETQNDRKKGNTVSSSTTTAPARKKTAGRKKIKENVTLVEGSGSDVGVKSIITKTSKSPDKGLEFEEDNESPQNGRNKAPARKKTAGRKKTKENVTLVEGSGSDVGVKNRIEITSGSHDKSLEFEEDDGDNDSDFEYEWPPLVCCFGSAQNEFVPTVRVSEKQMDEDMYSTWKALQWSPPEFARAPGGPTGNVAIALARLGGRVAFMGKVGDDPFGYRTVQTMNKENVRTRGVKFDPYASTSISYMKISDLDDTLELECVMPCAEDCFHSSEIDVDILKEARMFHFNSMALLEQSTSTLAAIKMSKEFGGVIFFDPNLPLPLWRSREETRRIIQEAWNEANVIEVTIHELDFLLDEDYFYRTRHYIPQYYSRSSHERKQRRKTYHYTREDISPLWHDNIKILFVTDGTLRIHYYTPTFEGEVTGTEDVLVASTTCDRTGSGDAMVAAMIRKLTTQPELYHDQVQLDKQLRFVISAGIIAQWTTGSVRGLPTESAAQNLKEQVYVRSLW